VVVDCDLNTVVITVYGGTPNYRYSIDGGITYSPSTGSTTYSTTITPGSKVNAWVKDSTNQIYRWFEIDCGMITVTIQPIYSTYTSEGYIIDANYNQNTEAFQITLPYNSSYSMSATPLNDTLFKGWSDYSSLVYGNPFELLTTYQHIFRKNQTIYVIFSDDTIYSEKFCVQITTSGYEFNEVECTWFCDNCPTTTLVYFTKVQYESANGDYTKVTWYKDINVTTLADNGYYKLSVGNPIPQVFMVNNGIATPDCDCGGGGRLSCPI
jgi:hypothetical protein